MIKVGSLFSGIGGFEKGIEDCFDGMAETVWQVEQNSFCQKVLMKHWPNATIFDDVRTVGKHNLEPVHILCGGFPCQSISQAGKMEGLENENKSGLWWEMHRIIGELRPRIAILENVANVLSVGGPDVVGSLAKIGYDCEWTIIRASDFGAPHHRARWFCVAYSNSIRSNQAWDRGITQKTCEESKIFRRGSQNVANPHSTHAQRKWLSSRIQKKDQNISSNLQTRSHWAEPCKSEPTICRMDDGISARLDRHYITKMNQRLKALGNSIVPQCSEWVARQVLNSGLLDDLVEEK
jgi:DNA (cytosine-5)-methyltransferase 1